MAKTTEAKGATPYLLTLGEAAGLAVGVALIVGGIVGAMNVGGAPIELTRCRDSEKAWHEEADRRTKECREDYNQDARINRAFALAASACAGVTPAPTPTCPPGWSCPGSR